MFLTSALVWSKPVPGIFEKYDNDCLEHKIFSGFFLVQSKSGHKNQERCFKIDDAKLY